MEKSSYYAFDVETLYFLILRLGCGIKSLRPTVCYSEEGCTLGWTWPNPSGHIETCHGIQIYHKYIYQGAGIGQQIYFIRNEVYVNETKKGQQTN